MRIIRAILLSVCTYTRINIPLKKNGKSEPHLLLMNLITIGVMIGFLWALLYGVINKLELPVLLNAAVTMIFPFWFSRYLHLEGFIDTSAEILSKKGGYGEEKHSSYGLISLVIIIILTFVGFCDFSSNEKSPILLFFIPIISRELAVLTIFLFPSISEEEYKYYKRSIKSEYIIILIVLIVATAVLMVTLCGKDGTVAILAGGFGFLFATLSARRNIGISGDTTGYAITVSETCAVVILAAFSAVWR